MNLVVAAMTLVAMIAGGAGEQPFTRGETLDYTLTWLRITGGTARMTIGPTDDASKLRITSVAKSSSTFSRFFRVHDQIETIVARNDFSTLRYTKTLNERGDTMLEVTTVEDGVATRVRRKVKKVPVPRPVFDPISVIYYFRGLDLSAGKIYPLTLIADGKVYTVRAYVRRRETLRTPAGTFNTVVVEPEMTSGGTPREETLTIWYSDDARHVPVRIRTEAKFGAVTATLREIRAGVGSIDPPPLSDK